MRGFSFLCLKLKLCTFVWEHIGSFINGKKYSCSFSGAYVLISFLCGQAISCTYVARLKCITGRREEQQQQKEVRYYFRTDRAVEQEAEWNESGRIHVAPRGILAVRHRSPWKKLGTVRVFGPTIYQSTHGIHLMTIYLMRENTVLSCS